MSLVWLKEKRITVVNVYNVPGSFFLFSLPLSLGTMYEVTDYFNIPAGYWLLQRLPDKCGNEGSERPPWPEPPDSVFDLGFGASLVLKVAGVTVNPGSVHFRLGLSEVSRHQAMAVEGTLVLFAIPTGFVSLAQGSVLHTDSAPPPTVE